MLHAKGYTNILSCCERIGLTIEHSKPEVKFREFLIVKLEDYFNV
jgi:hypothetical protein